MAIERLTFSRQIRIVLFLVSLFEYRALAAARAEQQPPNNQVTLSVPNVTVSYIPRSCHEAWKSGHPGMKESGMYWIDPDGLGMGEKPIYVYCSMTNGETSVSHDTEDGTFIPACISPGCHARDVQYLNATQNQLISLTRISQTCFQEIEVNCLRAPFEIKNGNNLESVSWWLDRSNNKQVFWSGDGSTLGHTCQCGLDSPKTCIDGNYKCNCDANVAIPLTDAGKITDKTKLPVTGFRFGGVAHEGGSYRLGKLRCKGADLSSTENGSKPETCAELWQVGHTLNGFYLFHKKDAGPVPTFAISFCNFENINPPSGLETPIGTIVGKPA